MRRNVIVLKGALFPVRDAVAGLIRADAPYVRAETKVYLNDTLDHSISLIEMVETQRDMLTGLIDMHLSLSPGPHQRDHLVPDDRLGDLHSADLPRRRLGHELRPGVVALEHAGTAMAYYGYPTGARLHGAGRRVAGRLLPLEEMAVIVWPGGRRRLN